MPRTSVQPDALGTAGKALEARLGREGYVRVGGLHGGSAGFVLGHLARRAGHLLVVVSDARAMDAIRLDLDATLPTPCLPFPAWPRDTHEAGPPDPDVLSARVAVLEHAAALRRAAGKAPPGLVVVAPIQALVQPVPAPDVVDASTLVLRADEEHPLGSLLEHLALSGYARVGAVEAQGEFAARGGVVDVWPWGAPTPARLDFFGDEVESIRELDAATQRSGTDREELRLFALAAERFRDPDPEGGALLPEHLPATAPVARIEPLSIAESVAHIGSAAESLRLLDQQLSARRGLEIGALPLGADGDLDVDVGGLDDLHGIALRGLDPDYQDPGRHRREPGAPTTGPERSPQGGVEGQPEERTRRIAEAFERLGDRVDRMMLYCRAPGEEDRLQELFGEHAPDAEITFQRGSLSRSFRFGPTRTAHIAYDDLADMPLRERKLASGGPRGRPIQDFLELEVGGTVVHLHHGIGLFRGLVTLEGKDGPGEFLRVEFAEGTTVYVPVARIDLVQRYVGTGRVPRLSKLGSAEWGKRKKKVAAAVEDLAKELLATQAARLQRQTPPFPPDAEWQREFVDAFPFPDTPDQASATVAVREDLESMQPMDRLLCGDVGYGKTEVALRALFKVVCAGRQCAVLVPTKVLCEQHVRVFTQRLAPYPIRVRPLSGLHAARENKRTLAGLADGTVDVVVGTHRLLSKDVSIANLGLVIVDEEQRFGVKQKERLKAMRARVDILTLSATPIPRTLHMALLGIRDISNLTTPPLGRHPVETVVSRESDEAMADAVRREIDRGGQVFVVNSRIRELPIVARRLAELVPEARAAAIHGQMDKDQIEARMLRFVRGEVDVLLATTIIESGLDIPNANTIVIRDADRYGLAELHQLRGRVGRERRRAHALLLLPRDRTVKPEAAERLRAIEEYSELGAGFRIAMRDLEIRGAGNLLGAEQSGHIAAVGYDLFCKLLAKAVRRVKGDGGPLREPAYLAVDLPGGIPDDYVSDGREKFRLFRRLASAEDEAALDDLARELEDRFGAVPLDVERLVLAQRVRLKAGRAGVVRIEPAERPGVILRVPEGSTALERLRQRGLRLTPLSPDTAFLAAPGAEGPSEILEAVCEHLDRAAPTRPGRPS